MTKDKRVIQRSTTSIIIEEHADGTFTAKQSGLPERGHGETPTLAVVEFAKQIEETYYSNEQ